MNGVLGAEVDNFLSNAVLVVFQFGPHVFGLNLDLLLIPLDVVVYVSELRVLLDDI